MIDCSTRVYQSFNLAHSYLDTEEISLATVLVVIFSYITIYMQYAYDSQINLL